MAEVARIADPEQVVHPRYETVPHLRSREPNLAVYRSLGVPVFRPRDGHVFNSLGYPTYSQHHGQRATSDGSVGDAM
jgi:hypothetical protein